MKAASFCSADDSWCNGSDSNIAYTGHQFSLTYNANGRDTRDDEEWCWDDNTPWRWYEIAILDSMIHHPMELTEQQPNCSNSDEVDVEELLASSAKEGSM